MKYKAENKIMPDNYNKGYNDDIWWSTAYSDMWENPRKMANIPEQEYERLIKLLDRREEQLHEANKRLDELEAMIACDTDLAELVRQQDELKTFTREALEEQKLAKAERAQLEKDKKKVLREVAQVKTQVELERRRLTEEVTLQLEQAKAALEAETQRILEEGRRNIELEQARLTQLRHSLSDKEAELAAREAAVVSEESTAATVKRVTIGQDRPLEI